MERELLRSDFLPRQQPAEEWETCLAVLYSSAKLERYADEVLAVVAAG